jgi:predicted RNase H-like HicB family nuclease
MLRVKEKVGVLPEVELDNYSSVLSGVARIDVDPLSGTVRVVPTVVESCLGVPLVPGDALPAYCPSEIVYGGKRYVFREPLECAVYWDEEDGDFLWVECAYLGLHSTGYTLEVAIDRFNEKFGLYYERNRELLGGGGRLGGPLAVQHTRMTEVIMAELPVELTSANRY